MLVIPTFAGHAPSTVCPCPHNNTCDPLLLRTLLAGRARIDEREGREYRPVVLFNPRLNSGDVGLGLNARRMRSTFLNNFVVTYSLRPINEVGSVYRRYPGMWKVRTSVRRHSCMGWDRPAAKDAIASCRRWDTRSHVHPAF
eukprot:359437-Chlamydomonas_euryale.AAC.2